MTDTPWKIGGQWLEYCSCDAGCPCESMAPPTRGHCDGAIAFKIDKGHFGETDLSGLTVAATFFFPRAIHHGGGHMQPILEERTSEAQREAIFTIMSGEGQPVGTMFQIFSIIVETIHEPIFAKIGFEWDMAKRTARLDVPGVVRTSSEPIRNPVTDTEHRILTVLPDGWVFYEAEIASGTAKATGAIKFDYSQRHSSLGYFSWDNNGMAQTYDDFLRAKA